MNFLNLGCGNRLHPAWTNVDYISPKGSRVIPYDLAKGLPFPDASFEVVYHSHFLEHLQKEQATFFLKECYRILRSGGVIRVVVPDLEQISRSYILALEQVISGLSESSANYDWLLIEMLDQMTRNASGGEMATYLTQERIPNEAFVLQRIGTEARKLFEVGQHQRRAAVSDPWLKQKLMPLYKFFKDSKYRWDSCLKIFLSSKDYEALRIGRFRQSGEIHRWMYDRYSLTRLLKECGFQEITQRTAADSYIKDWTNFNLDTEADGTVYKPDSLYVEAIKPSHECPPHKSI